MTRAPATASTIGGGTRGTAATDGAAARGAAASAVAASGGQAAASAAVTACRLDPRQASIRASTRPIRRRSRGGRLARPSSAPRGEHTRMGLPRGRSTHGRLLATLLSCGNGKRPSDRVRVGRDAGTRQTAKPHEPARNFPSVAVNGCYTHIAHILYGPHIQTLSIPRMLSLSTTLVNIPT